MNHFKLQGSMSQSEQNLVVSRMSVISRMFGHMPSDDLDLRISVEPVGDCTRVLLVLNSRATGLLLAESRSFSVYDGLSVAFDALKKQVRRTKGRFLSRRRTRQEVAYFPVSDVHDPGLEEAV